MTAWAVAGFSLSNEREKGAEEAKSTEKRELWEGKGAGALNRSKTANPNAEDTVNTVLLHSLLERPEGQS